MLKRTVFPQCHEFLTVASRALEEFHVTGCVSDKLKRMVFQVAPKVTRKAPSVSECLKEKSGRSLRVLQESLARVSSTSVLEECLPSPKGLSEMCAFPLEYPEKSFLQECPTRVESVLDCKCLSSVSAKSFLHKCPTRVFTGVPYR